MTDDRFDRWFRGLGDAWVTKVPQKIIDICAPDVIWHENPLREPLIGHDAVFQEWKNVPEKQKDISYSHQLLSVTGDTGIARWHASYTEIATNKKIELDGIFIVTLDEKDLCTEFRQWWVSGV